MNSSLIENLIDTFIGNSIKGIVDIDNYLINNDVNFIALPIEYDERKDIYYIDYTFPNDNIRMCGEIEGDEGRISRLEFIPL